MTQGSKYGEAVVERPTGTEWAVTERGRTLRHSEYEVNVALTLLAKNHGKTIVTEEMLLAENVRVHRNTLATWRDVCFPARYQQIRNDLALEITEDTAARLYERAREADDATQAYIEAAVEKIDKVSPTHLAKNAASLAQATSQTIQTAELLRGKPTSIVENRSLPDLIGTLVKLGVAKAVQPEVIEGEAVDLPS